MSGRLLFLWAVLVAILYLAASRVQNESPAPGSPPTRVAPKEMPTAPVEARRARPTDTRIADFQRAARDALAQLPRERKETPGSAHHPPVELVASGDRIGQLIDRMQSDPALVTEGLAFFDACTRDSGAHAASRAVCLHYLRHWTKRAGKPLLLGEREIPAEIARLADRLPSLEN